jgi:hypothetical protein
MPRRKGNTGVNCGVNRMRTVSGRLLQPPSLLSHMPRPCAPARHALRLAVRCVVRFFSETDRKSEIKQNRH